MKLSTKIIGGFLVLIAVTSILIFFIVLRVQTVSRSIEIEIPITVESLAESIQLDHAASLTQYYDQVLTQAARNYAFTGDEIWKERYTAVAPELEEVIHSAIDEHPVKVGAIFKRIEEANHALVDLEIRAIDLVDEGRTEEAIDILDGDEYWEQKAIYSQGLRDFSGISELTDMTQASLSSVHDLTNRLHEQSSQNLTLVLIFLSVFFVVVLVIALSLTRTIVSPIVRLTALSRKFAEGDYSGRVKVTSKDELGQLATTYNAMASRISRFTRDLESKIKERTEELNEKKEILEEKQMAMLNVLEDIELEKDKALREQAKDEAILSSMGDGLIATDANKRVTVHNRRARLILGCRRSDLDGKIWPGRFTATDEEGKPIPEDTLPIDRVLTTGKPWSTRKMYFTRKNKTRFPVAVTAAPIKTKRMITGAVVVFRDITREIAVDRAKTEFVSLASHQLRTPLSAVSWFAEMLMDGDVGPLNEKQLEYMRQIYSGNQRMVELVNSLLDVSRLELGTFSVEPEVMPVLPLIQQVINEVAPMRKERSVHLVFEAAEGIPDISLDPKLTQIIVQNLLTNAIKYSKSGGEVTMRVDMEGEFLRISIEDSGIGIPRDQRKKMFTKLFRADNAVTQETTGTGLGLYIAKSILDTVGGYIWYESEEDVGSKFYVMLPLAGMVAKQGNRRLGS